jgi:Ser/Thr protein kinase RdoA (MazF antagonist)
VQRDPRAVGLRGAGATAAAALRALAPTVVHGEAFPSNVLLGPTAEVCLVDWETAGRGPGLLDLAALCAGWPPDEAGRIAAAYAEESDGDASDGDALALLPAARLVVALRWLGEPAPASGAGGGHARGTDWWAEAVAAAELLL